MKKIIIILFVFFTTCTICAIAQEDPAANLGNQEAAYQWQMNEGDASGAQGGWNDDGWGNLQGGLEAASQGLGQLNTFLNIYHSAHDLYDATRALDNNECQPDFTTSAQAMMPTSCEEGGACYTCYQSAVNELAFIRRQLARLSCIYHNTKTFNERAIAFGDNTSGIHAVNGLAWQYAKADIVAAYESFKHTYDDKYTGMMGTLDKSLHDIGTCEDQYGEHDWYQRFGFIYFEFMKEKYKRTD